MREYSFSIGDYKINFNDVIFDYVACRNFFPENICLNLIEYIKKQSGKKIAIIFGNCQTFRLKDFLLNNKTFSENYFIVNVLPVWKYTTEILQNSFKENFWRLCDLFISQKIKTENAYTPLIASRRIASLLPEDAKIIWIPNIYFDGYFPQYVKNLRNLDTDKHPRGRFSYGDKYVDAFLNGGGGVRTPNFGTCRIYKGAKFYFKGRSFSGR